MSRLYRIGVAFALFLGVSGAASAQTELIADKIRLGTAECVQQTGANSPEGAVTGKVCDTYLRTNGTTFATILYVKTTGSGNTGWQVAGGAWTHSGSYTFLDNVGDFVGIGTATPVTKLEVKSTMGVVSPVTLSGDNGNVDVKLAAIQWRRFNYDPTGVAAEISLWRGQATAEGELAFATNPGSGAGNQPTERMRINQYGYVGIGTTTPDFNLQVNGTVAPETNYTGNLGSYLKKWLTIHAAELRVETLVAADVMATIGGRINVAPTTQLTSDLAAGATTMYVKHNNLADEDHVRLEANGNVEWIKVDSAPSGGGPYTYTIVRNEDGSGANDWVAGDAVLNTGTTGDGYIDLYSDRSTRSATHYGPTIQGVVRTGTTYSNLSERWAIGNLNGLYGYATDIYGSAFGDPAKSWVKIDDTSGLRLGNNTTTHVQITTAGTATFTGNGSGVTNINGGNIDANTIAVNRLTTGLGGNALTNSQFRNGLREPLGVTGWAVGYGTDTKTWTTGVGYAGRTVIGSGTAWMNTVSTPEANSYRYLTLSTIACLAGSTYEFSAYLGQINLTNVSLALYFYDSAYAYVGSAASATTTAPGSNYLDGYTRVAAIGVAPANTKFCYLYAIATTGGTPVANPYLFITHAQFGERATGTTVASAFTTGGVTTIEGDQITTGAITAAKIAANTITADRMAVAGGWTWADAYFKKDTGTEATSSGMAPSDWPFYAGAQYANRATAPFRVSPAGAVTASSGTIGGFTLGSTIFWTGSGATSVGLWGGVTGGDDVRFWAGAADIDNAPFRVYESGKLVAATGYFGDGSTDVAIDTQGLSVGSSGRISAGGGAVVLDADGIELAAGSSGANIYKFDNGVQLSGGSGYANLYSPSAGIKLTVGSGVLSFSGTHLFGNSAAIGLGSSGNPFEDIWLEGAVNLTGAFNWTNPSGSTASSYPIVWTGSVLQYKSDGATENCSATAALTIQKGIVTYAACVSPDASPVALRERIQTLETRLAQLEAQMALLLDGTKR